MQFQESLETEHLTLVLQSTEESLAWADSLDAATQAEISLDWLDRIRTSTAPNPGYMASPSCSGQAALPSGAAPSMARRMLMRALKLPMRLTQRSRGAALPRKLRRHWSTTP
jgi:hypothetical protein